MVGKGEKVPTSTHELCKLPRPSKYIVKNLSPRQGQVIMLRTQPNQSLIPSFALSNLPRICYSIYILSISSMTSQAELGA